MANGNRIKVPGIHDLPDEDEFIGSFAQIADIYVKEEKRRTRISLSIFSLFVTLSMILMVVVRDFVSCAICIAAVINFVLFLRERSSNREDHRILVANLRNMDGQ